MYLGEEAMRRVEEAMRRGEEATRRGEEAARIRGLEAAIRGEETRIRCEEAVRRTQLWQSQCHQDIDEFEDLVEATYGVTRPKKPANQLPNPDFECPTEQDIKKDVAAPKEVVTGLCVVCTSNYPSTINLPCGHMCLCFECGRGIGLSAKKTCPMCREQLTAIKTVYKP